MKLLPDIRARVQGWIGLGDQRCGAVRCDAIAIEGGWALGSIGQARDAASVASLEECDAGQWIIFWVGGWVKEGQLGQVREE